jgi:hypothetical protein
VALNLSGSAVDVPTSPSSRSYALRLALRSFTTTTATEMMKLFQGPVTQELDQKKRLKVVWDIDRKLQGRTSPARSSANSHAHGRCWQPYVKGVTIRQQHLQRLALPGYLARPLEQGPLSEPSGRSRCLRWLGV